MPSFDICWQWNLDYLLLNSLMSLSLKGGYGSCLISLMLGLNEIIYAKCQAVPRRKCSTNVDLNF